MDDDLERLLQRIWRRERERFNYPALRPPVLQDECTLENMSAVAYFSFEQMRHVFSRKYLQELSQQADIEEIVTALMRHETGHYSFFPREVPTHLRLLMHSHEWFGEHGTMIYQLYADLVNEGTLLRKGLAGEDIMTLRRTLSKSTADSSPLFSAVHNLLHSIYARDFGLSPPEHVDNELLSRLEGLRYVDLPAKEQGRNLYLFGKALEHLFEKHGTPKDRPQGLLGISDTQIDEALSEILKRHGPKEYLKMKRFLKSQRPGFTDSFEPGQCDEDAPGSGIAAGSNGGKYVPYDHLIPLYDRWASLFGLQIADRIVECEEGLELYRAGKREYELGDPLQRTDVFGSRGFVGIPGISKTHLYDPGVPGKQVTVPAALIGIDSSSSMLKPDAEQGAMQILAAFILMRAYRANGAPVGGFNFSTDLIYLPPKDDLRALKSLMCGYWNGGTTLDVHALDRIVDMTARHESGIVRANDLPPKPPAQDIPRAYGNMDVILITDGDITNTTEVVRHFERLAGRTRNFIFITNGNQYKTKWSKLEFPNTYIYLAEKPDDLIGLALGHGKSLAREYTR